MSAGLQDCTELLRRGPRDYAWTAAAPIPAETYAAADALLVERSRAVPGVVGYYRFGAVRYPGLSDLDALVVVEDGFKDYARLAPLLAENLPPTLQKVVLHNPYFIRRAELAHFFEFAPFFQYEAAWAGPGMPLAARNENPTDLWLFLMDIIAESYPREFIQFLLAPAIDERVLISRLKGLAYCFELLERLGGPREEMFANYSAAITELRENYFRIGAGERPARVLQLAQQALTLAHQLALKAGGHLERHWGLRVQGRLDLFCAGNPAIYWDQVGEQARFGTVRLRRTEVYAAAPAAFGWLVRQYALEEGTFSGRLRGRMSDRLTKVDAPPAAVVQAIRHRAALRNHHTAWADASGLGLSGFLTFGTRMRRTRGGLRAIKELAGRLTDWGRERMLRRKMTDDKL